MICSCRSLHASALSFLLFFTSRRSRGRDMSSPNSLLSNPRNIATSRLSKVSGHTTELLEIQSDKPSCHVLFIPGNPGIVSFYKDFLESLYELLGASASVTAIGHISHTEKNWEHGKLFSLQDQIDHKVDFIKQELQNIELPIVLVGHSIGSYISLEILRSLKKSLAAVSYLPKHALHGIDGIQKGTIKLMLPLQIQKKGSKMPDWAFMRENYEKIAFLFGVDDHWGPLQMFEEISKQVPGISLSIEREGHTHSFCCNEAGSEWVAQHVASLIKKKISS